MLRTGLCCIASLVACLLAAPAVAVSYSPVVDFRMESFWSPAHGEGSYSATQSGVSVTLAAGPGSAVLHWDDEDGIGIQYDYEDDEIEGAERLHVLFDTESTLSAIYLSDLFFEDGYDEIGYYRLGDGSWQEWEMFDATLPGDNENGERVIEFAPAVAVTGIALKAPGEIGDADHDFALMGLDVRTPGGGGIATAPVPEPTAFTLFCLGGLLVGGATRRRRQP